MSAAHVPDAQWEHGDTKTDGGDMAAECRNPSSAAEESHYITGLKSTLSVLARAETQPQCTRRLYNSVQGRGYGALT